MAQQYAPPLPHRPQRRRPGVSFAVVNAVALCVHLLLALCAAGFLATRVWGQVNIGMLVILVQGCLLLWTAARYDRHADEERS
ncbi:DUF485 domain-containing protein [Streptomyces sp. NPDC054887]